MLEIQFTQFAFLSLVHRFEHGMRKNIVIDAFGERTSLVGFVCDARRCCSGYGIGTSFLIRAPGRTDFSLRGAINFFFAFSRRKLGRCIRKADFRTARSQKLGSIV
jgi:hypothetical protein